MNFGKTNMIVVSLVPKTVLFMPTDRILLAGSSLRKGVDDEWWIQGELMTNGGFKDGAGRVVVLELYCTSYNLYHICIVLPLLLIHFLLYIGDPSEQRRATKRAPRTRVSPTR